MSPTWARHTRFWPVTALFIGVAVLNLVCARPGIGRGGHWDESPERLADRPWLDEAPIETQVGVAYRVDADVGRVAIPYVRRGGDAARPVLFILGGPSPLEWFGRHVEPVFDVVYLVPVPASLRLSQRVSDVDAVREHLRSPRISIFGHSEDGAVALEYAVAHPGRVERLVWVAGLSDVPRNTSIDFQLLSEQWQVPEARAAFASLAGAEPFSPLELILSLQARRFALDCVHPEQCRHAHARSRDALEALGVLSELRTLGGAAEPSLAARLQAAEAPDIRGLPFVGYRSVPAAGALENVPILMIQGALDATVAPETSRHLAVGLKRAQYLEYERSAHQPFLDEPERFIADLRRFLGIDASLPPSRSPLPEEWRPGYDTAEKSPEQLDREAAAMLSARRAAVADRMLMAACRIVHETPRTVSASWLAREETARLVESLCSSLGAQQRRSEADDA
jgi:proline iminopeptidase